MTLFELLTVLIAVGNLIIVVLEYIQSKKETKK